MHGRRSGKRLRMEEQQPNYNEQEEVEDEPQDAAQDAASFDPIAFYQQQRSAMLLESSHHVQASQDEIQRAQLEAQQREEQMYQPPSQEMGRRSRSAANAAKAALSMMQDDVERPAAPSSPQTSPARPTRARVSRTSFGSARSGRGRPAGMRF